MSFECLKTTDEDLREWKSFLNGLRKGLIIFHKALSKSPLYFMCTDPYMKSYIYRFHALDDRALDSTAQTSKTSMHTEAQTTSSAIFELARSSEDQSPKTLRAQ